MGRGVRAALCIGVAVLGMVGGALAGPTSPTINGATATFTGNQSNGIASGVDFSCPPVWTARVHSLIDDITPAAGVSGIKFRYRAADGGNGGNSGVGDGGNGGAGSFGGTLGIEMVYIEALGIYFPTLVAIGPSLDFSGGDYSISTSGANAHGISVSSIGGNGGNGGWALGFLGVGPAWGGHGGAGGWGGPVSVTSAGDITTNGTSSYGILAESFGGRGGNGGWAGGATYAVGGNGGAGGGGGSVTINNSSHIITKGESSDGIVGQSMGGAGGNGGDGGAIAGQGGGASGSGPGGTVTITNTGTIETQKEDSGGIFAQSVGGFTGSSGGGGGIVGWGGDGNSAGDGGSVTVTNSGTITTIGGDSDSIVAQSVGGGGGSASASGGIVGLGGTGSAGGDGGDVTVANTGKLDTTGDESRGILAHTVGGGGGKGGNSGGAFSFGGDGKATGDGGDVRIENSGAVTTRGYGSDSIFAESLGGGGGVTGGKGGNDYGVFVSYGGKGNSGGDGGDISIANSGVLKTGGTDAAGIFAQSIGGGGGNGGQAYDIGLEFTSAAGGNSSVGGAGGAVDVTAQAASSITTDGTFGHGIHAVSMGGGGGTGGNVLNITAGVQFSGTYSAGGRGGGGGDGNNVTVTNHGKIETHGEEAHGILAESVGGGGGNGGNVISWLANLGVVSEMPAISANLILGGTAGEGGNGATVAVTNTGDIDTFGHYAYGVLAQSLGGGGGVGGNAMAGTLAINSMDFTMSLGGNGSKGGNGGLVDVENRGTIDTTGHFSYGILAQSLGGGGGAGGNSSTLTINLDIPTDWTDFLPSPDLSATLSLGGKSGGGGFGGTVNVRNLGDISTTGEFSHGILAQSIGGGGGAGGDCTSITVEPSVNPLDYLEFLSFTSMESQLLLGARGGNGGNGGSVGVTNSGTIGTEGNFAVGILAQSIGGGGGVGGSVFECPVSLTASFDAGSMVLGGQGGSGGNGGAVTVTNSGDIITTNGGFSHGILAQSLGGGGGFAGISEQVAIDSLILGGPLGVSIDTSEFGVGFAGSLGGWGNANNVTVTHTGSIMTEGTASDGILAQSLAKRGQTGLVTINVNGDITANGQGSNAIHAQSLGSSSPNNGNVAVTINGGDIQGGSGGGAGVRIDGGKNNTLTNRGSVSALSGVVILAGSGNDAVHNYGKITGSVNLGSGVNSFHNYEGAMFNTGAIIDLGQENDLINSGVLAIGGSGVIGDTLLNGDLIQTDSGVIEIDVAGFAAGMFDTLDVTGTLTGGKIRFSLSGFDVMTLGLDEHESASIQFLTCDSLDGFGGALSYSYVGRMMGFQYGVYEQSGTLYLRITNAIPAPSALLLVSIGLGVLRLRRRRDSLGPY